MKQVSTKQFLTILAATLILLNGCTSSQLSETETQDQSDSVKQENRSIGKIQQPVEEKMRHREVSPILMSMPAKNVNDQVQHSKMSATAGMFVQPVMERDIQPHPYPVFNRESYNALNENPFITTSNDPLSTFSIDVDTASYANVRRFLNSGQLPPPGAVRIEEMINYFSYNYQQPKNGPIAITTELGPCPWQPKNKLVRIGLKAKNINVEQLPPSNLVFLIDVSGSMNSANKLPLLKQSMLMLVDQLTTRDRITIVVYAGSDRIVLEPTAGNSKETIKKAINNLTSAGSTHASSGITTAYKLARQVYMPKGNNRIILASDGDFNVGVTSRDELEQLITKERESGIYLTVLGFGMGNYHDDTMEILADKGNGNYSYIDSLLEAKKVLIKERTSTLFTLAKDVKLQIEFNPAKVGAYRLLGYENRALADEDFNNDKKDAGEIGVGHTVTALYELMPPNAATISTVDPLKYQSLSQSNTNQAEVLTVKLRYKPLASNTSVLITRSIIDNNRELKETSKDFRFAASVAGFGMLLKKSEHKGNLTYSNLITLARNARGRDREGYRAEYIRLLETAELLEQ